MKDITPPIKLSVTDNSEGRALCMAGSSEMDMELNLLLIEKINFCFHGLIILVLKDLGENAHQDMWRGKIRGS